MIDNFATYIYITLWLLATIIIYASTLSVRLAKVKQ